VTQCPPIPISEEYIIEATGVPFTCCPEAKYTACKHESKIYKVGSKKYSEPITISNILSSYLLTSDES
jgi:hypothetical protein